MWKLIRIIPCLLLCPLNVLSNPDTLGIKFVQHLSWGQIKEKAKRENKYVFVDCYATWCGPCKAMDNDVYPDEGLGKLFENDFISVKVQMDETKHDDEQVKRWRDDAMTINQVYKVAALPTFLFFNPQGELVLKEVGYKSVDSLRYAATFAMTPGLKYNDPYAKYHRLVDDFRKGRATYEKMNFMITTAKTLNEIKLADSLSNDFRSFLNGLPNRDLYKKEYIAFIASDINTLYDKYFVLFFSNSRKVDAVMGQTGYSQHVVDLIVKKQETEPLIKLARENKILPNWDSVYSIVAKKYGKDYADRGLLAAKVWWTEYHKQIPEYQRYFIDLVERYGIQSLDIYRSVWIHPNEESELAIDAALNSFAWRNVCVKENYDQNDLQFALKYMKGVVERSLSKNNFWAGVTYDTYAHLLFKFGAKAEAILWEKKALNLITEANDVNLIARFKRNIQKMEDGKANSDK